MSSGAPSEVFFHLWTGGKALPPSFDYKESAARVIGDVSSDWRSPSLRVPALDSAEPSGCLWKFAQDPPSVPHLANRDAVTIPAWDDTAQSYEEAVSMKPLSPWDNTIPTSKRKRRLFQRVPREEQQEPRKKPRKERSSQTGTVRESRHARRRVNPIPIIFIPSTPSIRPSASVQSAASSASSKAFQDVRPTIDNMPPFVPSTFPVTSTTFAPQASPLISDDILSVYSMIPPPYNMSSQYARERPLTSEQRAQLSSLPPRPVVEHLALSSPVSELGRETDIASWESKYARGAWIIPLRGPGPHPSAWHATIINSSSLSASLQMPGAQEHDVKKPSRRIVWTPPAILQFWKLLCDTRKKGLFGPIGIYVEKEGCEHYIKDEVLDPTGSLIAGDSGSNIWDVEMAGVEGSVNNRQEWIKVYCSGHVALRLRTLLQQFVAHEPSAGVNQVSADDSSVAARVTEISLGRRVLTGSRLLYVDELGKAILIA